MRRVSDHREDVLQDICVIHLVEVLCRLIVRHNVLQHVVHNIEPRVGHVAHGVFKGPDDRVEDELELGGGDVEECLKAVRVHRLQQHKEVGPVLRILFKVLQK